MQLKLIRFYKILSNFATSLISSFIPILVYIATGGNIALAMLSVIGQRLVEIYGTILLRHQIYKDPQLFLILRIIPIILIQICILFIYVYPIPCIIGLIIFNGLNYVCKNLPSDCVQSYSTVGESSSSTGLTRVFEQAGYVVAAVLGGLFLDNLPTYILVSISMALYTVSVFPLFIYYLKNHKSKHFNKETISNAFMVYEKTDSDEVKKLKTKIVKGYTFTYFMNYSCECAFEMINFYLYTLYPSFTFAGYLTALKEAMFGVGSYVASKLYEKRDVSKIVSLSCIINGLCWAILPFTAHIQWTIYVITAIPCFVYAFSSLYMFEKIMQKGRVIGITNKLLLNRWSALHWARILPYAICAMTGNFIPCFIYSAVGMAGASGIIPENEEYTRKLMVNCIEQNEIIQETRTINKIKTKTKKTTTTKKGKVKDTNIKTDNAKDSDIKKGN